MGPNVVSFSRDLHQQIFAVRCGGCHADTWGSAILAEAYDAAVAYADDIAGRVAGLGGSIMPDNCGLAPGQGNCLSVAQVELIRAWVAQGASP